MELFHPTWVCLLVCFYLCSADASLSGSLGTSFMLSYLHLRTALVAVAVFMLAFLIMKHRSNKTYKWPNGPFRWPLFGNSNYFTNKYLYFDLKETVLKYGKVFRLDFGIYPMVIIADPEILHDCFVVRGADFVGREQGWTIDKFTNDRKDVIFSEGRVWKHHRKLAVTAIRQYSTGEKFTERVKDSFEIVSATLNQGDKAVPVCVNDKVALLVYNVVAGMMYGKRFELDDEEFLKLKENQDSVIDAFNVIPPADFIPFLKYFPFPQHKRVIEVCKRNMEITKGHLEKHRSTFDSNNTRDFTDELILVQSQTEDPETLDILTDDDIVQIMSDMFFAGVETTTQTLSWVLMYIAAYPEVQKKLHQQIDDVLGREGSVSSKHKAKLPYIEAVIHEVMRMRPIAPFSVSRSTTCDTVIGDMTIPKGTVVMPYVWYMQNDPEIWKNPEEFNPDRFINADGNFELNSRYFMPFGEGRRRCAGEPIAKNEMFLLLTMVLQKFSLSFPDGIKPDLMPKPTNGFDMRPEKYMAIFSPRF